MRSAAEGCAGDTTTAITFEDNKHRLHVQGPYRRSGSTPAVPFGQAALAAQGLSTQAVCRFWKLARSMVI
jgi:hypothetical protein